MVSRGVTIKIFCNLSSICRTDACAAPAECLCTAEVSAAPGAVYTTEACAAPGGVYTTGA